MPVSFSCADVGVLNLNWPWKLLSLNKQPSLWCMSFVSLLYILYSGTQRWMKRPSVGAGCLCGHCAQASTCVVEQEAHEVLLGQDATFKFVTKSEDRLRIPNDLAFSLTLLYLLFPSCLRFLLLFLLGWGHHMCGLFVWSCYGNSCECVAVCVLMLLCV